MWISKQSSICCRGAGLGYPMDPVVSVQNKNFSGNGKELAKVLGADEETKSHLHRQFPRIWQILWRPFLKSFIVRQHLTDRNKMGLLRGQCSELRKGHLRCCCNQVWMKNGGRIPWYVTAICETYKISCLMGRHLTRGGFGEPFEGPVIPFGAMVEYHHISAKDISGLHQFGPKVLPGIFLGYASHARGIWKRDILVADIEELEKMDASEIHAKKTRCKGSVDAHEWWKIHIPNRGWNSKTLWRRSGSENIQLNQGNLLGESGPSSSTPFQDSSWCEVMSGPFQATFFTVSTLNPESNCTCPE